MAGTRRTRLGIVAAAAALLAGVGVGVVRADPSPSLPPVAPPRLLASSLEALAGPFSISGVVNTRLDLGLPQLPSTVVGGVTGPVGFLAGDERFRMWRSPDGVRVAHLLDAREQVFVTNRAEAWWWDSQTMTATALPSPHPSGGGWWSPARAPSPGELLEFSNAFLRHAQRHATVSVETTARVAGRPAYELALVPRSELTRIGRITVAIDAQTRLPLRCRVFPRGRDTAAIEAVFAEVSFDPIDPGTFAFSPPPGASLGDAHDAGGDAPGHAGGGPGARASGWRAFGAGFDLRIAVRLEGPVPGDVEALLPYAGPLASAIAVPRAEGTWLLAGFVDVSTLERDAATLP